ncbi:MAG: adenylate/guanylate cyclase domain-containing protein [Pirellulaceae bacterium]
MLTAFLYSPRHHAFTSIDSEPTVVSLAEFQDKDSPPILLQLRQLDEQSVWIQNLSERICEFGEQPLRPQTSTTLSLPITCQIDDVHVLLQNDADDPAAKTVVASLASSSSRGRSSLCSLGKPPGVQTLQSWFEALGDLQRKAACSHLFYLEAATFVVQPGGLDGGQVLMLRNNQWEIDTSFVAKPPYGTSICFALLDQMLASRQTVYHSAEMMTPGATLVPPTSYVCSPIFDRDARIVGAMVGSRTLRSGNNRVGIRALEAHWVQLVADAVSAGFVRLQNEADQVRTRILLEQFFSPNVARELERDPAFLGGQRREVSVLFADLRDFTALTDRLPTSTSYDFLTHVMDVFTEIVDEQDGAVIDYYGDGLAAMWNAPTSQTNHAERACRAGLRMVQAMQQINQAWFQTLGTHLQVGVGIHSGIAEVGNAGSHRRMKYGPRGATVNLASRVEGACKQLRTSVIISEETLKRLPASAVTRRICNARLPGFQRTYSLYHLCELRPDCVSQRVLDRLDCYEQALRSFESGDLENARQQLEKLCQNRDAGCDFDISVLQERVIRASQVTDQTQRTDWAVFDLSK